MTYLPPGGSMEVAFTLDTTGSMSQALDEVKGRVSDMMQRLLSDIPGIKMAAIAHGDYCDEHVFYLTQLQNLTSSLPELVNFVGGIEGTGGGDTAECYELVLKMARENLAWTAGSQRIVVMIGDAFPHPADDPGNRDHIDWEEQVKLLASMGVKIYGVQVFEDTVSSTFFSKMADATGGQHLKLTQFGHLCDVIMAICYREKGAEFLENFQAEVQERTNTTTAPHPDLDGVFDVLRRGNSTNDASDVISAPVSSDVGLQPEKSACSTGDVTFATSPGNSGVETSPGMTTYATDNTPMDTDGGENEDDGAGLQQVDHVPGSCDIMGTMPNTGCHPHHRRPTVASSTKTPTSLKKHAFNRTQPQLVTRYRRETVPETQFKFRHLRWSTWKLLAVPADQEVTSGKWRTCLSGLAKVRQDLLNHSSQQTRSGPQQKTMLVEVSVQTAPRRKRHVTWCRVVNLHPKKPSSISRLLTSNPYVRAQLQRVMRNGCRLFVRMAEVDGKESAKVEDELVQRYDYVWYPHPLASCRRYVVVPSGNREKRYLQIAGLDDTL